MPEDSSPDDLVLPVSCGDRTARWWERLLRLPRPRIEVTVLSRRTCPLCDEAWEQLESLRQPLGLTLRKHDLDGDPERLPRFKDRIPVILIEGRERFFGLVSPGLLAREVRLARRQLRGR